MPHLPAIASRVFEDVADDNPSLSWGEVVAIVAAEMQIDFHSAAMSVDQFDGGV
jgi:hypothetical protein